HPLSKAVLDSVEAQTNLLAKAKPPSLPPAAYLPPRRHPKHAPVDSGVISYLAQSLKLLPKQGNLLTLTLKPDTACRLVDLDARKPGQLRVTIYPADIMSQGRSFFKKLDVQTFLALAHTGWNIWPNFHLIYR